MSSLMKRNQSLEKSKRYWALGVGGAGVLSILVGSKFWASFCWVQVFIWVGNGSSFELTTECVFRMCPHFF